MARQVPQHRQVFILAGTVVDDGVVVVVGIDDEIVVAFSLSLDRHSDCPGTIGSGLSRSIDSKRGADLVLRL